MIEISNRQSEVPINIAHFENLVQRMLAHLGLLKLKFRSLLWIIRLSPS